MFWVWRGRNAFVITMLATDSQGNTRRKYIFERMCGVLSIGVEQKEGHIIFLAILSLFKVYHTGFKIPAFLDCVNWPFLAANWGNQNPHGSN